MATFPAPYKVIRVITDFSGSWSHSNRISHIANNLESITFNFDEIDGSKEEEQNGELHVRFLKLFILLASHVVENQIEITENDRKFFYDLASVTKITMTSRLGRLTNITAVSLRVELSRATLIQYKTAEGRRRLIDLDEHEIAATYGRDGDYYVYTHTVKL